MKYFYNVTQVTLHFKRCRLKKYGKMICLITSYNRKTSNEVFQQINKYLNHCSLWDLWKEIECPFSAILFSLSASYNRIIFYELTLSLVICPFPAFLFSLSASYRLIIFYELAILLVICPFPAILFHYPRPITLLFSTN